MITSLPPPRAVARHGALLLDFDGTLVDIAQRPDAVVVTHDLTALLRALHLRLGGALAVITGRALDVLDAFLAPLVLPAAGEHGIALRPDAVVPVRRVAALVVPAAWHVAARAMVAGLPGTLFEAKPAGFVVHYRARPEAADTLRTMLEALVAADARFMIQCAHEALELRPRGTSKGTAVRALMAEVPFLGRVPLFIGDDATDEAGIAAAVALGGQGARVPHDFATPAALRAWLALVLEADDAAAA